MKVAELRINGYKNLLGCRISLGDFNAVVGPNNSGKSNLLEVFDVLRCLCFGPDDERRVFFGGGPSSHLHGRQSSFLLHSVQSPLEIGMSFTTQVKDETWTVDYDLKVQQGSEARHRGFVSETLKAKHPSKTGPARKYIDRDERYLFVLDKKYPVPAHTSALSAMSVLYPEFQGLPDELSRFAKDIATIARTRVFALSPESLRTGIYGDSVSPGIRISAFSVLETLDRIQQLHKFDQFKQAVLHILDLQDVVFKAQDVQLPSSSREEKRAQRFRLCALQSRTEEWSDLAEYSDGTLIVLALVARLVLDDPVSALTCIEEVENCLHPSAQERLLHFLTENSAQWQLLITTHSPYLVNGLSPSEVIVAVVGSDGKTHFEKTSDMAKVNDLLKSGLLSFGDLMATNFRDALKD